MKKIIFVALLISSVSGCVSYQRSAAISATQGVTFAQKNGYEYIKSYEVKKDISVSSADALKSCVLSNVTNNQVQLTDASKSFSGTYTGNYYNVQTQSSVHGGSVIQAETKEGIIFAGTGEYLTASLGIKRTVRYTGEINQRPDHVIFSFSNIQQVQNDSGAISNNGFFDVGSWDAARPESVVAVLNEKANDITNCLRHK
ncbi:hypothetical protein RYQ87_003541 [Salmonella enterica]|uniref:hypothetical protein n=1 Tax=Salmonella enterica TaxID=28901 RepID=UPI0009ADC625|nr:hypothetical protein [Salmonella enterica]EBV6399853.1 hypothetical protein [Salmonella enterica subsp. enterica serovar Havana]EDR6249921.1 hypothetical protein [Salmonella enterica]ELM3395590.1 hypothetical protein [Salmonella enterica]ELN2245910.1 hypothetical protein [Salmonella enterica]EME8617183.1 hypothetical protein [Salmonella enterica]